VSLLRLGGSTVTSQNNGKPPSVEQPWWLGKAKRQHILIKFITICVVIALLIVGAVILTSHP
jgi:hypothetical protein